MFEAIACDKPAPKSLHELACDCEALLLVSREPLSLDELVRLTASPKMAVEKALKRIQRLFRHHGIQIFNTPYGWKFAPALRSKAAITAYYETRSVLSDESLETLAIVAYMQPITKDAIAEVRSHDPTHALETLLSAGLIEQEKYEEGGEAFKTTDFFLESAQISLLDDLPLITHASM
jgi:segregation and condensation protein B